MTTNIPINVAPTGSPTAILTGAVEDTAFSISEIDLLAGFSDADGDPLSIENLVATNGSIFIGDGYGNNDSLSLFGNITSLAAQSLPAISTNGRIFTFVPAANFNGIVNLTYGVTDGNFSLTNQTISFNVSPVNDAPTGTPTAILANAELNSPYTINTSDLLAGFSDIEGDVLSIENLTASNGSLVNNENGTYTFTPSTGFSGSASLNYNVTDGTTPLINQNININVGSVFSILPSISDEQIITSLLGNITGLSNFRLTTSGSRQAVGLFQNDPFSFGQGIVLSTGLVSRLVGSRAGNISTDFGNPGTISGGRDAIVLDITFDASITSDQIFFQYIFGSEEFTEFSGSSFNDASTLTLNGVNLARLTNGNTVTVNNLTPTGNPATFSPDYIDNNSITGSPAFSQIALDGFTRPLGFSGALIPGASNRLVITVQDISDGVLDSAIFLKANSLGIEQLPGVVQFLTPSYSVDENNATSATITIIRTGGDNAAASVQLNLSDGTATAPNDYLNEPITINFALGENVKTITVPITNDTIFELTETVNLTLSNPSTGLTIGTQSTAILTILDNDNIAPTGSSTAILTGATEDTAFLISAIDLLAGFSDANGDTLFVTSLSSSVGSITNNENGTYTFNPNANFNGDVTLTYGVTDGLDTLANQTLRFNVAAVNDAPTGSPTATLSNIAEDSAIVINAGDLLIGFSDVDGDILSIINLVANNGVLVNNNNGTYNFTPAVNFNGIIDLTYDVTDGTITLTGQTQSFGVTPVNDAPTLQQLLEDQSAGQNQPFTFTIPSSTFADIDAGDTLTLSAGLANGNPLPSWLSFNSATQTFSGIPPLVNIGSLNIRVTATDSAGASVSDVFALDIGLNTIGTSQADNLIGSNGFDTISGLNGNDTIDGGRGADRLDGGNGNDRLIGGTGRDTLIGGSGNDNLDGGADDDSYEASGTQAEFDIFNDTGVADSDTLVNIGITALTLNSFSLTNGIEFINGNNQTIIGNNSANVLNFSAVSLNNVLFIDGRFGDDSITGNSANNDLRGGNGSDTIDGGAGDDWLDGGSQNDSLLGAGGNDTLIGGTGNDTLDGGEGSDTYNVVGNQAEFDTFTDTGTSGVDTLVNLTSTALILDGFTFNNGIDVINGNNQAIIGNNVGNALNFSGVTFNNVAFVSGGNGNDSIIGTILSDNLQGGSGNDTINGGAGADFLDGGVQNDSLLGAIGDDTLVGGTGNDTLDGGDGSDIYEVSITQAEFDLFTDTGTSGNDILRNTSTSSLTLNGFSITNGLEFIDGNNRAILGNNNNNNFNFSAVTLSSVLFVDGGNGNDFLVGSAGSDNLRGGSGIDTIDGGNGADNLFGGAGNDSFIFNNSSTGVDTINDFTIGDTLQISSAGFGGAGVVGAAGALAAARFVTGTVANTAAHRFVYDSASGSLFFDIDGNGSASQVQIAFLNSRPILSNNSFSVF
jgi:Ca2+-binding RTX toxin-like protein